MLDLALGLRLSYAEILGPASSEFETLSFTVWVGSKKGFPPRTRRIALGDGGISLNVRPWKSQAFGVFGCDPED